MNLSATLITSLFSDSKSLSELNQQFGLKWEQLQPFINCQSHNSYRQYTQENGDSLHWCFLFELFTLIEETNDQQLLTTVIECVKTSKDRLENLGCMLPITLQYVVVGF